VAPPQQLKSLTETTLRLPSASERKYKADASSCRTHLYQFDERTGYGLSQPDCSAISRHFALEHNRYFLRHNHIAVIPSKNSVEPVAFSQLYKSAS
jgi:hypothetical protein